MVQSHLVDDEVTLLESFLEKWMLELFLKSN